MNKKAKQIIDEFERNHNHSWYEEIYARNMNSLGDNALFYRGTVITYGEMFEKMQLLASAMQIAGVKKGTEIPVCMSNTPELVYVMGAASMLGAVINVFSPSFPLDYITEIINGCDDCIGFFEDNHFNRIHTAVEKTYLNRYVLYSLGDSLPKGTNLDNVEGSYYSSFTSCVNRLSENYFKSVWFYDFIEQGIHHCLELQEKIYLEDTFTVTYTSGSTNALRPKAIVQRVRSFCTIGRFHDPDLTYGLKTKKYRWMAIIPPHSNTDLISCISDTLMQGATLTLEPIYNASFFLKALLINRPNIIIATRSFWLVAMKCAMTDETYIDTKLPFLFMVFAVGEELSINEEKFLNKALRRVSAGRDFIRLPVSPVCFCVGGGDCEHGSILHRLFRAITNHTILPSSEKRYGMAAFDFVDIAVLDDEGNRLEPNHVGRLVANSPCTMKCYKNDDSATESFFIKDKDGKIWGDMSVYGYIDKKGLVYMRNRIIDSHQTIPPFIISDVILKSKSILSCEVVKTDDNYVAHVEFLPSFDGEIVKEIAIVKKRCIKAFGEEIGNDLLFRIRTGLTSFPLTSSGKRDVKTLISEGTKEIIQI